MNPWWPKHKASMHLTHNGHLAYYESIEEYLEPRCVDVTAWVSPEQRDKALATVELWELQWYPETPIGFYYILAADFEALTDYIARNEVPA